MEEKIKKIDKERIKKAIDETFNVDPKNVKELWRKGFLLTEQKKYNEAKKYLDKALRINPKDRNALQQKGNLLRVLGKYKEAIEYFDKALEVDPKYTTALFMKIVFLEELIEPCLDKPNLSKDCIRMVHTINKSRKVLKKMIGETPGMKPWLGEHFPDWDKNR